MAEGTPVCIIGLPVVAGISKIRGLWSVVTVSARCRFNSREHRVRIPQAGNADKLRFFNIAQGSLEECRYYLILIRDLEYGVVLEPRQLLEEVSKLLEAYSRSILNSDS